MVETQSLVLKWGSGKRDRRNTPDTENGVELKSVVVTENRVHTRPWRGYNHCEVKEDRSTGLKERDNFTG